MATGKMKFGIVAMCDHVYRDQQSSKAILAGLFSGDMLLSSVPAAVPVCFYIEIVNPKENNDEEIDIQIFVGSKMLGGAKLNILASETDGPAIIITPPITLQLEKATKIELRAKTESAKAVTILKKAIRLRNPAPTA